MVNRALEKRVALLQLNSECVSPLTVLRLLGFFSCKEKGFRFNLKRVFILSDSRIVCILGADNSKPLLIQCNIIMKLFK